jgi:hypothetical protein
MLTEPNFIGLYFGTCLNGNERRWSAERAFSANILNKWPVAILVRAERDPTA